MFAARAFLTPYTRGKTLGARREPHHQNSFCRASQCCCLPSSSRRTSYTSFALAPHTRHARHPRDAAGATPRGMRDSARRGMRDIRATLQVRYAASATSALEPVSPRPRPRALLVSSAQVARVGRAGARGLDKFVRLERVATRSRTEQSSGRVRRDVEVHRYRADVLAHDDDDKACAPLPRTTAANAAARPSAAARQAPQRGLALHKRRSETSAAAGLSATTQRPTRRWRREHSPTAAS
jgi:hypothetical protein